MTSHALRARPLARRALLPILALTLALQAAPAARAAVSNPPNDELARYADQLFTASYPAGSAGDEAVLLRAPE